ncbi:MAG: VOC family protein [Actinomycetota bacterium]
MSGLAGLGLRGVWHFSFTVSHLDRSIAFYRDLLGLELVHTQEQDNAYTRRLVGFPDAILRVAQLAVPGQPRGISTHDLELVEYVRPRGVRREGRINDPAAAHLAVTINDAWAVYERLTGAAVRFVSPPNAITAGINEGGYACYFYDPDDIVLELLQPPAHRLAGA